MNCAHCHGLAGDGKGWDGSYLNPSPADFQEDAGVPLAAGDEGKALARVTFGIKGTSMPELGRVPPTGPALGRHQVPFVEAFRLGKPVTASVAGNGEVAADFATLSPDNWTGEGHVISLSRGADVFSTYCATCHGPGGDGQGYGDVNSPSGGPARFPAGLSLNYVFWRVWDGVPESVMPPFARFLSDEDVWNVVTYTQELVPAAPATKGAP